MRIARVELFAYTLPLAAPFHGVDRTLTERRGLVVRLHDAAGHVAYGEAAPFPGLRAEPLQDARRQLAAFLPSLKGRDAPHELRALDGSCARWLVADGLLPSVRFAIESALLGLLAAVEGIPLRALLRAGAHARVPINALFDGREPDLAARAAALRREGIRAVKIKAVPRDGEADVANAATLREALGPDALLRLDAKCAWELPGAVRIGKALTPYGIDYIEEPLAQCRDLAAFYDATGIATALDENLRPCVEEGAVPPRGVRAFVIKPDIVGGLEASAALCRRARALGIVPVISATFLSGIGVRALGEFAAAFAPPDVPMGLGTSAWLADDLARVPLRDGALALAESPDDAARVRVDLLAPIPLEH